MKKLQHKLAFIRLYIQGEILFSIYARFLQIIFDKGETSDIYMVQEMLGHRSVSTTQRYLGVNYTTAREACEAMSVFVEHDIRGPS